VVFIVMDELLSQRPVPARSPRDIVPPPVEAAEPIWVATSSHSQGTVSEAVEVVLLAARLPVRESGFNIRVASIYS
jgi:hypothetical protein